MRNAASGTVAPGANHSDGQWNAASTECTRFFLVVCCAAGMDGLYSMGKLCFPCCMIAVTEWARCAEEASYTSGKLSVDSPRLYRLS